jgi:hypothetical protein
MHLTKSAPSLAEAPPSQVIQVFGGRYKRVR